MSDREHLSEEDKTRLAAGEGDTLPPAPRGSDEGAPAPSIPSPDTPAPDADDDFGDEG
ncbi:hypothetical protein RZO50_13770 [Microbacterium sp. SSW1-59]|uniref:hypothetical protein n=1 Tax=Microbacterium xanthum TaxID=3079794 RepID=UPI002AD44C94|nr:hypothetical protein [Microbacterium sp. SSW1-59]MDZ8202583.1 hypothetical protein [Microbacterium sp. SSW1-59]